MAQVNKTIYPDGSSTTYYTTTHNLSGSNFPSSFYDTGLDHSITYTASTNPQAPYRTAISCDMQDTDAYKYRSYPSTIQRLAIAYAWPQNFGSDVCSVQQILNHPWDANYNASNVLYSAFQWNGICGRILCTFYEGSVDYNNRYKATWKDFKDIIRANPGNQYYLESVWAADVKGGNPSGRRDLPIKAVPLYKYAMRWWNFYENREETTGSNFVYCCLRPQALWANGQGHMINNVQDNNGNSPDMCWAIYNNGYGLGGYTADAFGTGRGSTSQQINGKLVFGVDQGVSDTTYLVANSNGAYTYAINVNTMGVENTIDYIEQKAACLGIILFQDCKAPGSTTGDPGVSGAGPDNKDISSLQAVFGHTDIFVPITDENGYFNGDFLVYGDDPTGTSAETMILGDKDTPFDDGAGTVDPEPPSATGIEFIFTQGTGDDANYFIMNFGCAVHDSNANFYPTARGTSYPDLPGVWNGKRIVPFYGSPRYSPVLRWTSLRTNVEYELEIRDIVALNENYLYNAVDNGGWGYWYYTGVETVYNWDKGNTSAAIRCLRWLPGEKEIDEWDQIGPQEAAQDFDNWKDFRIVQQFSLGEVVNYMKSLDPSFEDDDVYSELFLDFVNLETGNVNATLSLDYSDLFETGVDPNGGGGGGGNTNNQWDNDSTDPKLNPDEVINIPMIRPNLGPVGVFNKTYAINSNDLQQLSDIISSTDDDVFDAVLDGLKMFGANPINALVDLRLYPYDVANQLGIGSTKEIILGRYETGIYGANMAGGGSVSILDLGKIYVPEKFGSFLDYEPYTVLQLYIPYIGTVELPPALFMKRTVSVRMVVDYTTGAALAVVYSNGIPMIFQSGVIGTSISMTGDNAAQYANGIIGNFLGAAGSAAKAIGSAIAKPTPGTIANAATTAITSVANALDSINETHFQQAGSASPCCNNCTPQQCYLTISRPVPILSEDTEQGWYGQINGFATEEVKQIRNIGVGIVYAKLGYFATLGANEPKATQKEVELITNALNNGFYV